MDRLPLSISKESKYNESERFLNSYLIDPIILIFMKNPLQTFDFLSNLNNELEKQVSNSLSLTFSIIPDNLFKLAYLHESKIKKLNTL